MLENAIPKNELEQILDCKSVSEIWKVYLKLLATLNFDRIIYATTNLGKSGLSESLKDGLVLSNHHPTLIDEMVKNNCFDNDTRWYSNNQINVMPWEEALGSNEIDYSKYLFFPIIKNSI